MNKSELIELKKKLDTEKRNKSNYMTIGAHKKITPYVKDEEIKKLHNEKGAIDDMETYFEKLIYYLSANNQPYDELNIYLQYSIFAKESDYNEWRNGGFPVLEVNYIPVMEDYVELTFGEYIAASESGRKINSDPKNFFGGINNRYIVSLTELKKELYIRGFELSTNQSFEEIKKLILRHHDAKSEITINFSKPKTKTKKRIG